MIPHGADVLFFSSGPLFTIEMCSTACIVVIGAAPFPFPVLSSLFFPSLVVSVLLFFPVKSGNSINIDAGCSSFPRTPAVAANGESGTAGALAPSGAFFVLSTLTPLCR